MGDREIIIGVKQTLQDNLEDPRSQWTGEPRDWVHTDRPLTSATFPRIQVRKRGPTTTDIVSMGRTDFMEWRSITIDIQMWIDSEFKYEINNGSFIKNEEIIKEWLSKIWETLKSKHTYMINNYGVTGLKLMNEEEPYLEPDTSKYTGKISIRLWEFTR